MKTLKHFLLTFILLGNSTLSLAQQGKPTNPPPPPPPPANDYFPKRWKEFASSEGRFKILFPGTPQEFSQTEDSEMGKLLMRSVRYKSFISYAVFYIDYPQDVENPATVKRFLDLAREGGIAAVAKGNPQIIKESEVSMEGHPGRFLQLELAGNAVLRVKWIVVKNRLYSIAVTTPKGHPGAMGAENDYEEISTSFLNSFQLM